MILVLYWKRVQEKFKSIELFFQLRKKIRDFTKTNFHNFRRKIVFRYQKYLLLLVFRSWTDVWISSNYSETIRILINDVRYRYDGFVGSINDNESHCRYRCGQVPREKITVFIMYYFIRRVWNIVHVYAKITHWHGCKVWVRYENHIDRLKHRKHSTKWRKQNHFRRTNQRWMDYVWGELIRFIICLCEIALCIVFKRYEYIRIRLW